MKRFPRSRAAAAATLAIMLLELAGVAWAQEYPPVSARPGQRTAQPFPEAAQGGTSLSLSAAIGLALANNQDLNVSVNEAEASRYLLFQNMGIFDPLLRAAATRSHQKIPAASQLVGADVDEQNTFSVSADVTQLFPTGGTFSLGFETRRFSTNSQFFDVNPSYSTGLTAFVSQPLLRNFGWDPTVWLIRTARNTRDIRYQDFVRDVQLVVQLVEDAYWDLVYALQNLEVKREARTVSADLNRITRIKIDVGSLAPIDIVQTEVGIATAEQEIILAEDQIGDAQDRLKRLMNLPADRWSVPIVPTDEIRVEQVKVNLEEGVAVALQRRPEILAATYAADSQRLRYEFYKNQTRPQLDLVGSYGFSGLAGVERNEAGQVIIDDGFGDSFSEVFDGDFDNWSVGLVFSVPIFNRTARGRRGESLYTWEASKASRTAIEQNVNVEVRNAARTIDTASRSIEAARKSRELGERNLDAERKKFENGMTTSFQVTEIQRDLSLARSNELQALTVYRKAVSAYHFAIADILDWRGVRIADVPEPGAPEVRMYQLEP